MEMKRKLAVVMLSFMVFTRLSEIVTARLQL